MSADFEDWTRGVTVITGATPVGADFPDWTVAIAVEGGGGGGAYASLTGPGETVTPGALDQEGGFAINQGGLAVSDPTSSGISLATAQGSFEASSRGMLLVVHDVTLTATGSITMTDTTPGCEIDCVDLILIKSEQSNLELRADNASVNIVGDTTGLGHVTLDASNVDIAITPGSKVGFFNPAGGPVGRQTITGSRGGNVALANLLSALNNLGIIANSTTP